MKTDFVDFNRQLCTFKDGLRNFAMSFTKNADDADDLVQDTLLKAIRYAQKFQEGTNLKSWLYMILRNTFINNYRRKARIKSVFAANVDVTSDQLHCSVNNLAENKSTMDDINKAMSVLSPDYYIPFTKYFEGYKYYEIAEDLNIPIGTVKTRIHIARIILKKNLKMYHDQFMKMS